MNFFEQVQAAEFVLVSGDTISTNFTWDEDLSGELEDVCLTIWVEENELVFTNKCVRLSERVGDAWIIGGLRLEFCKIAPIEDPRSSRRDRFVDRCIEMRQAKNVVARALLIETDDITIELVKLEIKHMQNCLNEMEEVITELDFPGGLTQVA